LKFNTFSILSIPRGNPGKLKVKNLSTNHHARYSAMTKFALQLKVKPRRHHWNIKCS